MTLVQPIIECEGDYYRLDIRRQMLTHEELAQGMSFPKGYIFRENRKEDIVKQIGNAVPVSTTKQLIKAIIRMQFASQLNPMVA